MSKFKSIIKSSFLGEMMINKLHEIEGAILPKIVSDEKAVKMHHKKTTGKELDLDNPVTFSEKLNWYKLNGRNPLMVKCADKIGVREYAKENGFEENLNEIYEVYDNVNDIDISKLPDKFVLKATHGTHMQIIVKDKNAVDWKKAKLKMKSWLKQDIYWRGREWVYKDMPHRIIAEKYIEDSTGELRDFKFFCFNGNPEYMQYDIGRFKDEQYRNYYDMCLNRLPISDGMKGLNLKTEIIPVEQFEKMKEIAKKLAAPFQQVRVDFYYVNGRILIGEMTFFDGGGSTVFTPEEWNYKFSEKWILVK